MDRLAHLIRQVPVDPVDLVPSPQPTSLLSRANTMSHLRSRGIWRPLTAIHPALARLLASALAWGLRVIATGRESSVWPNRRKFSFCCNPTRPSIKRMIWSNPSPPRSNCVASLPRFPAVSRLSAALVFSPACWNKAAARAGCPAASHCSPACWSSPRPAWNIARLAAASSARPSRSCPAAACNRSPAASQLSTALPNSPACSNRPAARACSPAASQLSAALVLSPARSNQAAARADSPATSQLSPALVLSPACWNKAAARAGSPAASQLSAALVFSPACWNKAAARAGCPAASHCSPACWSSPRPAWNIARLAAASSARPSRSCPAAACNRSPAASQLSTALPNSPACSNRPAARACSPAASQPPGFNSRPVISGFSWVQRAELRVKGRGSGAGLHPLGAAGAKYLA